MVNLKSTKISPEEKERTFFELAQKGSMQIFDNLGALQNEDYYDRVIDLTLENNAPWVTLRRICLNDYGDGITKKAFYAACKSSHPYHVLVWYVAIENEPYARELKQLVFQSMLENNDYENIITFKDLLHEELYRENILFECMLGIFLSDYYIDNHKDFKANLRGRHYSILSPEEVKEYAFILVKKAPTKEQLKKVLKGYHDSKSIPSLFLRRIKVFKKQPYFEQIIKEIDKNLAAYSIVGASEYLYFGDPY